MDTNRLATGLGLHLVEYEINDPDKEDYLKFVASVRVKSFAGTTTFRVAETDIDTFGAELAAFGASLEGSPELRCGAGTMVIFKMSVAVADNLGHATVRLELRAEFFPPENMLIVEFGSEPQLLVDFAADLQNALVERKNASVHLPWIRYYHHRAGRARPGECLH